MKKLSLTLQWLVVAALAAFAIYLVIRPVPRPDYAPGAWQAWNGITVLSYAGIARTETPVYPSVKRLEAQLTALREAGYRTVQPEDVRAFLDNRAPLPEKALLLIFEGGRKEAFIRATPVLQRAGFSAVIVVPTTVMSQWGGFYLKKNDIRRIVRMPQWQVGSMGHQAVQPAPGCSTPEQGHYLSQRGRVGGKQETADAFHGRILEDYAESARALKEATGKPPLLYLYPYADAGQYAGADPQAEAANREAVTRNFALAFVGSWSAFNGPDSDPWSLTRLRVPGDWSPERLLAELASNQPRRQPQTALGVAQDWVFEREADMRGSTLHLPPQGTAWLRGTEAWADEDVSVDLLPGANGSGALYARYTGTRSWLRIATDADGIRIQERLGDRLYTLGRHPTSGAATAPLQVRLRLRNNRAWVWLNGKAIAENLPISPDTRRGRVGFGCDRGELSVTAFSARRLPERWVLVNSIRLIHDNDREQVQAVLPNWFRNGEKPTLAVTAQQDLLQAAVTGIRTIPRLSGGAALDARKAGEWAASIDAEIVRVNAKALLPILAVEGPAFALAAELRNRHYRVAHILTPEEALNDGRTLAEAAPDEMIAVNGIGENAEHAVTWLKHTVPTSRLVLREPDDARIGPGLSILSRYDSLPAP